MEVSAIHQLLEDAKSNSQEEEFRAPLDDWSSSSSEDEESNQLLNTTFPPTILKRSASESISPSSSSSSFDMGGIDFLPPTQQFNCLDVQKALSAVQNNQSEQCASLNSAENTESEIDDFDLNDQLLDCFLPAPSDFYQQQESIKDSSSPSPKRRDLSPSLSPKSNNNAFRKLARKRKHIDISDSMNESSLDNELENSEPPKKKQKIVKRQTKSLPKPKPKSKQKEAKSKLHKDTDTDTESEHTSSNEDENESDETAQLKIYAKKKSISAPRKRFSEAKHCYNVYDNSPVRVSPRRQTSFNVNTHRSLSHQMAQIVELSKRKAKSK